MNKRCTLCEERAEYAIKNTNDYYCRECAEELFDNVSCLVKVEERNASENVVVDQLKEFLKRD